MPQEQRFSQASTRVQKTMLDQHGRQYAVTCEIRTNHPVGPKTPLFQAPLMPPDTYVRPRRPGESGRGWANPYCELVVDYDAWIKDIQDRERAFEEKRRQLALEIGGTRAHEEYENPSPLLLAKLGPAPDPLEPVLAARDGNPWILGLRRPDGTAYPKPKEAEKFFPEKREEQHAVWGGTPAGQPEQEPMVVYPRPIPGGRWKLSDGRLVKCTREEAEELEQAIQEAKEAEQLAAAGAAVGPGWGEE